MTALVAARILNGEGGTSATPAWIVIGDGRIVATGQRHPAGGATDLGDAVLAPGFVDIQVERAGRVDFARHPSTRSSTRSTRFVAGGCTACLPTICTAPLDAYDAMLDRLAAVRAARPESVLGVHLEGPFLGGAPGAHPPELRPRRRSRLARRAVRPLRRPHRLVTLAPEADPGFAAIAALAGPRHRRRARPQHVDLDGALAGGRRRRRHRDASVQRHGAAAPPRAGPRRRRARRPAPGAVAHRRRRARAPDDVAPRAPPRPDAVLVTDAVATAPPCSCATVPRISPTARSRGRRSRWRTRCGTSPPLGVRRRRRFGRATGNPARAIGATEHGRIAPGCRADLVALDPGDARGAGGMGRAGVRR